MIEKMKFPLLLLIVIALSSNVLASVTCDSSSFHESYSDDSIPTSELSISQCSGTASSIYLTDDTYLALSDTSISGSKNIKLTISQSTPPGTYLSSLIFEENSTIVLSIPLLIEITDSTPVQGEILIFPTSSVVTVQQESEKTKSILITVPSSYPRTITIQSVDFNPGVEPIFFSDLNLGQVQPGQSLSIPIIHSGLDAQVGTYETNLNIFATDSEGQIDFPTINLKLQVTSGVSPTDETTFSTRPSCSLSSSNMNLNQTYTFTCSGVVNNLDIIPQFNEFFQGTGVDFTSNIYTYTFRPVKYGNTDFVASFSYRGSPLFEPFSNEVRISSSTGQISGTSLKFLFTPSLESAKNGQTVAIQLLDNKTDSLVENPEIEVDAIPIANKSGKTFLFSFESNKNYTIRGYSPGYNDLVKVINMKEKSITININPETGKSTTMFNITTEINATIYVNGDKKGNSYYGTLTAGENSISAYKEGYTDTSRNISVDSIVQISQPGGEFKKGVLQTFMLNKNSSWKVSYQKDDDSIIEFFSEGTGSKVEFEPDKKGKYIIEAGDAKLIKNIEGWDFGFKIWRYAWYWWVILILGIYGFYYYYLRNGVRKSSSTVGFGGGGNDYSPNLNY